MAVTGRHSRYYIIEFRSTLETSVLGFAIKEIGFLGLKEQQGISGSTFMQQTFFLLEHIVYAFSKSFSKCQMQAFSSCEIGGTMESHILYYATKGWLEKVVLPPRQIKYLVDFDGELKIGDVRYDNMT